MEPVGSQHCSCPARWASPFCVFKCEDDKGGRCVAVCTWLGGTGPWGRDSSSVGSRGKPSPSLSAGSFQAVGTQRLLGLTGGMGGQSWPSGGKASTPGHSGW